MITDTICSPEMNSERQFNTLRERFKVLYCGTSSGKADIQSPPKMPNRKNLFFCKTHILDKVWLDEKNGSCKSCFKLVFQEKFYPGKLPLGTIVLSRLITLKENMTGKHANAEYDCAVELVLLWVYSTVYPLAVASVKTKLLRMFEAYRKLKKFSRKSDSYWITFK